MISRVSDISPLGNPLYAAVQSLPEMWAIAAQRFSDIAAVHDPHSKPEVQLSYAQLYEQMQHFAAGLQTLGIAATANEMPPRIALFADNSPRWIIADQGIMRSGAADVVRGAQADCEELLFILQNSGAIAIVVQTLELFHQLRDGLQNLPIQFVILLSDEAVPEDSLKVLNFTTLLELGKTQILQPVEQTHNTVATLMYTSGTSGLPKGVMLTHGNLMHQVNGAFAVAQPEAGERVLSILPIWHAYERAFEYYLFSNGCTQIYTNLRFVKQDLKDYQPHYMVGVPRLWESIYEGIQKQFREQSAQRQKLIDFCFKNSLRYIQARRIAQGLNLNHLSASRAERVSAALKAAIIAPIHQLGNKLVYRKVWEGLGGNINFVVSGGGSISDHLEDFFEIVGVVILGGYGLTETSPITHVRRLGRNVRGADGEPLPHTETRIVDPETRKDLPIGQCGLVLIRGLQVMQGYYNNPQATEAAIDDQGWFNTGDLGRITRYNDLIITGRIKDTIVLTNGENIAPQPIEDACLCSPYIDQILLVGHDQKALGALIVPNLEAVEQAIDTTDLHSTAVQELYRQELTQRVKERAGYRNDDRIAAFRLLSESFTAENGLLTQTLKIRRNVAMERYQSVIDEMFSR